MQVNEISYVNAVPIDGYGPGFFRIDGKVLHGAIYVTAAGTRQWGGYEDTEPLIALVNEIDVLFIGTGAETAHIPQEFRATLEEAGLGVETMNSPTACRTYNVLLSEGRRIAVALLPL